MKYLEKQLAREIEERYDFLQNLDPSEIKSSCGRLIAKSIEKNSQIYSYRMEHPKLGVPFSVPRNKNKKAIKEGIKNIDNAFKWGCANFNPEKFDESFVREIAGRITPELYDSEKAEYRTSNVRISGASIMPPYPHKIVNYEIPEFVKSLKTKLKCNKITNKIESAIYAHLSIARIHPFFDGNGRTARVLQDVILNHYSLPPPVIETGERMTYYKILDRAIMDLDATKAIGEKGVFTEGENLFYSFIAGKVNSSLDKIITRCNNHFH